MPLRFKVLRWLAITSALLVLALIILRQMGTTVTSVHIRISTKSGPVESNDFVPTPKFGEPPQSSATNSPPPPPFNPFKDPIPTGPTQPLPTYSR
ncbi:MAG: hypothetical protein ACAI35_17005 [Candidatus Methylacidiphilales bacterium]